MRRGGGRGMRGGEGEERVTICKGSKIGAQGKGDEWGRGKGGE